MPKHYARHEPRAIAQSLNCRDARTEDLLLIDHLQARNSDAVGWLPAITHERAIEAHRLLIVEENNEPVGFLLRGPIRPITKIYQACIMEDARRRMNGEHLVQALARLAELADAEQISLHCAHDLEGNQFWRALQFEHRGIRRGRATRGRIHNRWVFDLPAHEVREAQVAEVLKGEKTLEILDLIGVRQQFTERVKKRLRKQT